MKTILITNIVVLNGGDAAILFGMMKSFRRAFGNDCRIHVYASQADVASRIFPDIEFREALGFAATRAPMPNVRYLGRLFRIAQQARYLAVAWCWARGVRFASRLLPSKQRRYLQEYAEADLVASSGGTYLKEEYGVGSQACDYRITLLLGTPLVFFTQSLGPFTRDSTRRAMRMVFSRASSILLRDERSRRNITDLGVASGPMHLAPDAAFALADPAVLESAKCARAAYSARRKIAISVRHWQHFTGATENGMQRYRMAIAEAVRYLARSGAEVTFISTCQGIPEYDDDSIEAAKVTALLDPETASHVRIVRRFIRFDELMGQLGMFDLCIGTRMHMCILSLISGTPVLPVAYEFKTRELFAGLAMSEWVTDMESIAPESFVGRVKAFEREIPSLRARLFDRVLELHYEALGAADHIRRDLDL